MTLTRHSIAAQAAAPGSELVMSSKGELWEHYVDCKVFGCRMWCLESTLTTAMT